MQKNESVLHTAVRCNNFSITKSLLEAGANVNEKNNFSQTALHVACWKNLPNIIKLLVENGAKTNSIDCMDNAPLHIIPEVSDNVEIFAYLVSKGAKMELEGPLEATPVHRAAFFNRTKIVKFLLSKGVNPNYKTKLYGETPLHGAALRQSFESIDILIEYGANINTTNNAGESPLISVLAYPYIKRSEVIGGDLAIVKYLIEHGARPSIRCKKGFSALDYANQYGRNKEASADYLKFANAFYSTLDNIKSFTNFAKNYLKTGKNITNLQNLLHLDKEKKFTDKFNEWCKQNKKTTSSANPNLNTITTTANGLTTTPNLCATMGNLSLNKK